MDNIHEVSSDSSLSLARFTENYYDSDQTACRDPFDIAAEKEEEIGHPLNFRCHCC